MIERIVPPGVPVPRGPYSPAVRAGDFIYVADGEAHKNHRRLLAAWVLLADRQGLNFGLRLPGVELPENLIATHDLQRICESC